MAEALSDSDRRRAVLEAELWQAPFGGFLPVDRASLVWRFLVSSDFVERYELAEQLARDPHPDWMAYKGAVLAAPVV